MGIINRIGGFGSLHGSLDVQVSAGADDGYWEDWYDSFGATDTTIRFGYGTDHMFARFGGITIPAGAIIKTATLQFYRSGGDGTVSGCRLYFNKSATPTAPTSYSSADGKTLTTAYVSWDAPGSGTGWITTGDMKTAIQELINAYGAYNNGYMMLLLKAVSDANYCEVRAQDYSGNTYGAKLHIEW